MIWCSLALSWVWSSRVSPMFLCDNMTIVIVVLKTGRAPLKSRLFVTGKKNYEKASQNQSIEPKSNNVTGIYCNMGPPYPQIQNLWVWPTAGSESVSGGLVETSSTWLDALSGHVQGGLNTAECDIRWSCWTPIRRLHYPSFQYPRGSRNWYPLPMYLCCPPVLL